MTSIFKAVIAITIALQVVSCGKNNDNSSGGQTALAPSSFQSCSPGAVNNYSQPYGQPGYAPSSYYGGYNSQVPYNPYRWGNNYNVAQSGFCGCSFGEVPACNPGVGLYCVPAQGLNYAQYNYNGSAYSFNGYNQFSGNSCSTGVGQICQVGVAGACGQFGRCDQTSAGYGICVTP